MATGKEKETVIDPGTVADSSKRDLARIVDRRADRITECATVRKGIARRDDFGDGSTRSQIDPIVASRRYKCYEYDLVRLIHRLLNQKTKGAPARGLISRHSEGANHSSGKQVQTGCGPIDERDVASSIHHRRGRGYQHTVGRSGSVGKQFGKRSLDIQKQP